MGGRLVCEVVERLRGKPLICRVVDRLSNSIILIYQANISCGLDAVLLTSYPTPYPIFAL